MKEQRPTLCIVAGPNGSGKTTTTLKLLANEWAALLGLKFCCSCTMD